jgi:N6-adenosine-specific RNA methylase IME4
MNALVRYEEMRVAVEQCARIDEAAEIRDKAAALQAYARQRDDRDLDVWTSEIKLRASVRIGELVRELDKAQTIRNDESAEVRLPRGGKSKSEALSEAGLSKSTAHRYQELAGPRDAILQTAGKAAAEVYFAKARADREPATMDGLKAAVTDAVHAAMGPAAIKRAANVIKRETISKRRASVGTQPSDQTCTVADLDTLVAAGMHFGTIYADPPWLYDNQGTRAATGNHYSGMTVDELCALPVQALAAPDAHLHLWTTNAFLFEAPRIFAAWGFEFRSSFVWVKPQIGIGNYWRNSHEFLLTAIRGNAKSFADHSLASWMSCDRGAHSAKPEQVRHMLERASPGPRLEMFGRSPADGWAVWGNQIERGLLHQNVRELAA